MQLLFLHFLAGVVEHFENSRMFSDDIYFVVRTVSSQFCNGEMERHQGRYSKKSDFIYTHPQMIFLFTFLKTFYSEECLHNINLVNFMVGDNRLTPRQHPISLHYSLIFTTPYPVIIKQLKYNFISKPQITRKIVLQR